MSLMEHRFDPNVAFLELVSMKTITSKWKEMVIVNDSRPERVGYLYKQSSGGKESKSTLKSATRPSKTEKKARRQTESTLTPAAVAEEGAKNFKSLRKRTKRWFVLKGLFLAYFKTRDESAPSSVIPLDYYIVRLSDDIKKGERVMSLDKCTPVFPGGTLEDLVLATEPENENELRLWFQSTNGKCANTALNRVFGMPLLHQLCHNQHGYVKRPSLGSEDPLFYLPPFLTQCTKFLAADGIDQEGLFRISHTTYELLTYREFFDTGAEIDLEGTSAHCVAGLIKAWLRELPEALIPNEMYHTFLQTVATTKDKELKRERVLQLLEHVPIHSLRTLSHIASFMKQIVSYTVLNRMTFHSLAIVLAPCILRHADPLMGDDETSDYNPLQLLKETPQITEVIFIIFENSDALAQTVERLAHESIATNSPPSDRREKNASSPTSASAFDTLPSPTPFSPSASAGSLVSAHSNSSLAGSFATAASTAPASADPRAIPFNPIRLPQVGRLASASARGRKNSNGVIRSLNEELPPLKEGQIAIFTPSGVTPTVTIEPSPRSLRASSPKWNRKHRNTTQWKGGAVGNGRVSGTTSPVPPLSGGTGGGDGGSTTDEDFAFSRRNSEDIIGHNLHLDASKFLSATAHHHHETMSLPVSPRGGSHTAWSQPASPDPEARLISMIMNLQQSHDQLASRVLELEERLAREIAQRTALEHKLSTISPNSH